MSDDPVAAILARIAGAPALYHRLILVAGPGGSGKTAALQAVAQRTGAPVVNLNLELSRRLLDLSARQRVLEVPRLLIGRGRSPVLLDNPTIPNTGATRATVWRLSP